MSVQRIMETVKTNVLTLTAAIHVDAGQGINWLWIKGPVKVTIATIRINYCIPVSEILRIVDKND